jgi:hypothetical protein
MSRKDVIRDAVDGYFAGLAAKDFDRIPFAEDVSFRAPLAPGACIVRSAVVTLSEMRGGLQCRTYSVR